MHNTVDVFLSYEILIYDSEIHPPHPQEHTNTTALTFSYAKC